MCSLVLTVLGAQILPAEIRMALDAVHVCDRMLARQQHSDLLGACLNVHPMCGDDM